MSISVKNLTYTYNKSLAYENKALDNISFEAKQGELIGVIGETGSGKSTLMLHLNGLIQADSGIIDIDGSIISAKASSKKENKKIKKGSKEMLALRKKVGLVFQYPEYQLFEETVEKDVAFGPKNLGISGLDLEIRVREAIEMVGLDYELIRHRSPFDLSGGQKRRVALAGIIAMHPSILILDEPTAGLDPKSHRGVFDMIARIRKATNCTVILVSHNMDDISEYSDKVLVLKKGKVIKFASPKEVFFDKDFVKLTGLALPQATSLARRLASSGLAIDTEVLTLNELASSVAAVARRAL
jgi:energy-coupling factor transport system ATP-binding protein